MSAKSLILCEKPSVAKSIAEVICAGNYKKHQGHITGEGNIGGSKAKPLIITWAIGHLLNLAPPQHYGLNKWDIEKLPLCPDYFALTPVKNTREQLEAIQKIFHNNVIECLIVATDAAREGEAIADRIIQEIGYEGLRKRLWISSYTPEAIQKGFQNLKAGEEYNSLALAARARAEADWLVGINATIGVTLQSRSSSGVLSVGRVQSPTLKIICDRYLARQSFVPQDYFEIHALVGNEAVKVVLINQEDSESKYEVKRFDSIEEANKVLDQIKLSNHLVCERVEQEPKTEYAPLLFDLASLQKTANKLFGFTAEETLKFAQSLYEKHKLLTYPRTDNIYLTSDLISEVEHRLSLIRGFGLFEKELNADITGNKVFNDNKKSDHHAIIPTSVTPRLETLTSEEQAIYLLVCTRLLECFSLGHLKEITKVFFSTEDTSYDFLTQGTVVKQVGWKVFMPSFLGYLKQKSSISLEQGTSKSQPGTILPEFTSNEKYRFEASREGKKTKSPALHTDASLLSAMENAGNLLIGKDSSDESKLLKKVGGIGTPATRANIIETLIKRGYLYRQARKLIPSEPGLALVKSLGHQTLFSPKMTAKWEERLSKIEALRDDYSKANKAYEQFKQGMEEYVGHLLAEIKASNLSALGDEKRGEACPNCGSSTLREGAKYIYCESDACGFKLWRNYSGTKLNSKDIKELLSPARTTTNFKKLKSKAGKEYQATLKLVKSSDDEIRDNRWKLMPVFLNEGSYSGATQKGSRKKSSRKKSLFSQKAAKLIILTIISTLTGSALFSPKVHAQKDAATSLPAISTKNIQDTFPSNRNLYNSSYPNPFLRLLDSLSSSFNFNGHECRSVDTAFFIDLVGVRSPNLFNEFEVWDTYFKGGISAQEITIIKSRAEHFFPMILQILEKQQLPLFLAHVAIIESALDHKITSSADAVGLWQLLPQTARKLGLEVSTTIDERMDVKRSTEVACKSLKYLYRHYRDWKLALIAYNFGQGRLNQKIIQADSKSYSRLWYHLPRETQHYLPALLAAMKYIPLASKPSFKQVNSIKTLKLGDFIPIQKEGSKDKQYSLSKLKKALGRDSSFLLNDLNSHFLNDQIKAQEGGQLYYVASNKAPKAFLDKLKDLLWKKFITNDKVVAKKDSIPLFHSMLPLDKDTLFPSASHITQKRKDKVSKVAKSFLEGLGSTQGAYSLFFILTPLLLLYSLTKEKINIKRGLSMKVLFVISLLLSSIVLFLS